MDNQLVKEYVSQLSPVEKVAIRIAKTQLGTSFDLQRSIGFLNWLENRKRDDTK